MPPLVGYHVTRRENRDSIEAHGLDRSRGLVRCPGFTPGNFVFDNLADAERMVRHSEVPTEVWRVDLTGLDLLPDLANQVPQEKRPPTLMQGSSFFTVDPIPPERLKRISTKRRARR